MSIILVCIWLRLIIVDSTVITSTQPSCLSNDAGNACVFVLVLERERQIEGEMVIHLCYFMYWLHPWDKITVGHRAQAGTQCVRKKVKKGNNTTSLHDELITGRGDRGMKTGNPGAERIQIKKGKQRGQGERRVSDMKPLPGGLLRTPVSSWA